MKLDVYVFFFSSRRRHTRWTGDWSSDVCSSDLRGQMRLHLSRLRSFNRSSLTRCLLHIRVRIQQFWTECLFALPQRSEERRVGKECRSGWSSYHYEKNDYQR